MKKVLIVEEKSGPENGIATELIDAGFKTYISAGDEDGVEIAVNYQPDLIICNTKKKEDGFNVLQQLRANESTDTLPIIFLTKEFDNAVFRKAMELGADDYLAYPIETKILVSSINALFSKREKLKEKLILQLSASFGDEEQPHKKNDHILVKIGNKLKFVRFNCIVVITALKEYSQVITNDNCRIVVRKSLRNWEDLLPGQSFLRIHRATIVNMDYVEKIEKTSQRSYEVHLKNIDEPFQLSQRFANIMRKTFPS